MVGRQSFGNRKTNLIGPARAWLAGRGTMGRFNAGRGSIPILGTGAQESKPKGIGVCNPAVHLLYYLLGFVGERLGRSAACDCCILAPNRQDGIGEIGSRPGCLSGVSTSRSRSRNSTASPLMPTISFINTTMSKPRSDLLSDASSQERGAHVDLMMPSIICPEVTVGTSTRYGPPPNQSQSVGRHPDHGSSRFRLRTLLFMV